MQEMAFKSLLSSYNFDLAQVTVCTQELESLLIKSALNLMTTETSALAKCFDMTARDLEYHIHPFQQFASVPNGDANRLAHLDPINKIAPLQRFLT